MPPDGFSALPAAVRAAVPTALRYWTKAGDVARSLRDDLGDAVRSGDVKLPGVEAETQKAAPSFVLQEQTWRGPLVVRFGPSRELWHLWLDEPGKPLVHFELEQSPVDNSQVAAFHEESRHRDAMALEGALTPGHYLNPTKDTPSVIRRVDAGKLVVLERKADYIKATLQGKRLKSTFLFRRNNGEWLMQETPEAPVLKGVGGKSLAIRILKAETEKRLITGAVLVPEQRDAQGDIYDDEVVSDAAYDFLAKFGRQSKLGLNHEKFGMIGVELVESWLARQGETVGDTTPKEGTWLMTVRATDSRVWDDFKRGVYTGFSIGGKAMVRA